MSAGADPLAGIGAPVGAPPPPSSDPLAGVGAAVGAPATADAAPTGPSLGDNLKESLTHELPQEAGEAWQGMKKGGAETLSMLGKLLGPRNGTTMSALDYVPKTKSKVEAAANAPLPPTVAGKTGYGLENILEFMSGDEAFKSMTSGEKFAHLAPLLKTLEKYPRVAEALQTGLKAMGIGTAQAGLHGADTTGALESGIETGLTAGTLHGAIGALASSVRNAAPTIEEIAGEPVQTLSSQRPGTGPRGDVKVNEVPKVAAAQQAAAPKVFRNIAQRATRNALDEANQGRRIAGQITDPARMLPAPADMQPYPFTIEGTGTAEESVPGGNEPRKRQIGTQYVAGKGSGTAPNVEPYNEGAFKYGDQEPLPPVNDQEPFTGPTHKEPVFQYLTDLKPGQKAGSTSVTGGGDLVAATPEAAQTHLSRLNDIVDNPPPSMSAEQLSDVTKARDNLADQMHMYHAYQRTLPNFSPINSAEAAQSVDHFGAARDQLQNAATPIYQKLDEASDGEFGRLNRERAAAGKRGDFTKQYELEGKIRGIIDGSDGITHAERAQATNLWSKAMVLDGLHSAVEHAANVNERYASEVAGGRVLSGVRLQNGLNRLVKQYGQDRLESVIGRDGMENMTRMADLLNTPKGTSGFKGMSMSVMHNLMHGKIGGAAGAFIGHQVGGWEGALAGSYAGAQAERWMLQQAATNPRIGQLVDYAVRNNVTPKVAAGLISSAIIQENQPQQDEKQQEAPQ